MKVCFVVWLSGGFVVLLNAKSAFATTNNTATKQQDNKTTSIVWKTIPSEARVTRDEVSGYMIQTKTAVWKTVPCIGWIPMLLVQSSRQLSFSFYNPETYKTPSYLLAGWRLDTLFGL